MADHITEYRRSSLGEMLQAQLAAQSTLDSLTDPVFVFAPSGAILSLNRAAEELFPRDPDAAPELPRLEPPLRDALEAVRTHVLQGKGAFSPRSFDEAFTIARPDGERVFLPRAAPVYEEGGGIVAATVVLQDVTRLRRFEELRDDLVSTVAHQFRTPLTSLRMAIHLCIDGVAGPLSESSRTCSSPRAKSASGCRASSTSCSISRGCNPGPSSSSRRNVTTEALVERAVRAVRSAAAAQGIELLAEPLAGDASVRVDLQRIDLVFSNLLENALRHTPSGGRVAVRALLANGNVRFEVTDSGPGIPEAERHARVREVLPRARQRRRGRGARPLDRARRGARPRRRDRRRERGGQWQHVLVHAARRMISHRASQAGARQHVFRKRGRAEESVLLQSS